MPKLGLSHLSPLLIATLAVACKAAPEPTPAEASAPTTAAADAPATAPPAGSDAPPAASGAAPRAADAPLAGGSRLYGETTKTVSAKPGERFGIALASNVTVPYKWRLEPPDAKVLVLTDEKQVEQPPPGCGDCVGTGGTRVYTFEAKGAGTASLHFSLKPLTDPKGAAQKEVTIAVTVAP